MLDISFVKMKNRIIGGNFWEHPFMGLEPSIFAKVIQWLTKYLKHESRSTTNTKEIINMTPHVQSLWSA